MHETPDEIEQLQDLLDRSAAGAGPHLRSIITDERRLSAEELCARLTGMRLLVLSTVTADGRPLSGPVDGYLLHGSFYFSSGRRLGPYAPPGHPSGGERRAPARRGSGCYRPRPGRALRAFGPAHSDLRQAMLDHYLPQQGPAFETWLDEADALGARIEAERMFTFHM